MHAACNSYSMHGHMPHVRSTKDGRQTLEDYPEAAVRFLTAHSAVEARGMMGHHAPYTVGRWWSADRAEWGIDARRGK